jgi:large conductance mechanosensitive channel
VDNEAAAIPKEFKEFALRGNVVNMAVGIIIGASFSTIVKSLVDDIIMPPFGVLMEERRFSNPTCSFHWVPLRFAAQARQAAPTLNFEHQLPDP